MSTLIDLDDVAALEKLGLALCKIPSVVISFTKSMIQIPEARKIILANFDSPEFGHNVEKVLLTSELKPIKRIAELETVTGTNDFSDFEEEDHEPTIPEQIALLEEKIGAISEPVRAPREEHVAKPEGVAENRAVTIYNEAKKALETGTRFFGTKQVNHILKNKVPEQYRVKEGQNVGQAKKEAFVKLKKLFPGMFDFKPKTYGRKDVRLIFQS
jgi:hypothetical protein